MRTSEVVRLDVRRLPTFALLFAAVGRGAVTDSEIDDALWLWRGGSA